MMILEYGYSMLCLMATIGLLGSYGTSTVRIVRKQTQLPTWPFILSPLVFIILHQVVLLSSTSLSFEEDVEELTMILL